jgi:putative glutamine amidotransferase
VIQVLFAPAIGAPYRLEGLAPPGTIAALTDLPLIAVAAARLAPGRVSGWTDSSEAVQSQYLDGLRRAGGLPVALGGPLDADPRDLLAPFAGLVLLGGADVDPARYGQDRHPEVYGTDSVRDDFEIGLIRAALDIGVPLFGVCRGVQVVNVALGGTLWQHLPDLELPVAHGVPSGNSVEPARHPVDVAPGSRLAKLVGGAARVEDAVSIHHQAVRDVAPGLVPTAWTADGLVEALETPDGGPWCVAVQWHPERSAATDSVEQGLFDGFVAAIRR